MPRILCFGASLTEGYTWQQPEEGGLSMLTMYPYSTRLKVLLSEHCKDPVEVETRGMSGERVINEMSKRLDKILKEAQQPYDWILFLGGTNDLGYGEHPDTLLTAICRMHDRARTSGARTVALAIPEFALELKPEHKSLKDAKAKVNAGMKEYCEQSGSQSVFVDLHSELPHAALKEEERVKYWCDGLHMTPRGYDRMAEVIFSVLKNYL